MGSERTIPPLVQIVLHYNLEIQCHPGKGVATGLNRVTTQSKKKKKLKKERVKICCVLRLVILGNFSNLILHREC